MTKIPKPLEDGRGGNMKTHLFRSRRTVYVLAISLLVALTLPAFSAFAWGPSKGHYKESEVIFTELSNPWMLETDWRGNIYFREDFPVEAWDPLPEPPWMVYPPESSRVSKYNPRTGETTVILEHDGYAVELIEFDFFGNMYFLLRDFTYDRFQIHKLKCGADTSEIIYEFDFELDWLNAHDMAVDWLGNIYFSCFDSSTFSGKLMKIPRCSNTPELLVELPGAIIHCIEPSVFLREGVYFATWNLIGDDSIFQFKDGVLTTILQQSGEDFGYLGDMTYSPFRGLYYVYRQRSGYPWETEDIWGYLEIGQFTQIDLLCGRGPKILSSENSTDWAIALYMPGPILCKMTRVCGRTGDLFTVVVLYYADFTYSISIMWLHRSGKLEEIFASQSDVSFVIGSRGDIYCVEAPFEGFGSMTCIYC